MISMISKIFDDFHDFGDFSGFSIIGWVKGDAEDPEMQRLQATFDLRTKSARQHAPLKGLRPLPPTPPDSRIFGFLDFSIFFDFEEFSGGI